MEIISQIISFILHIDQHLLELVQQYGVWTIAILALIVFCETGLVVTPFLPGDSLLFAAGALSVAGGMPFWPLVISLLIAAIVGDTLNYHIGHWTGGTLVHRFPRLCKPAYIERTKWYFEKYGGKTIIIARFVPIVRTFAPFFAGAGAMTYRTFIFYNVVGAVLWVVGITGAGYLFGNIPVVKNNFTLVVFAIIGISILPIVWEAYQMRKGQKSGDVSGSTATVK